MRQPAPGGLVEMIEGRVGQQHQVDRWQVLDFHTGSLEPFQQEKPVRKIRVDEHVEIVELDEERSVADPGDGHFTVLKLRKNRASMLAMAWSEPGFEHEFMKKRAWIEMFR